MEKQIIINFFKKYGFIIADYIKKKFEKKIINALKSAWDYFLNFLWESIKEDIKEQVKETCEFVNNFFDSDDTKEKADIVLENLLNNIHLPLVLKPFKPLIKRALKAKIKKLIKETLKKLQGSVNASS